ncbi:two-component system, chemotaxis family, response regulator CheY [Desulfacinum hydrothermale DSM 13146]|uniref:Two-component system, chemotaxis family, response regulator CheY n=2 Tax=Desulfacinum hydrothermale TaxID=109258 RepID=A0A1W1X685_9BACT|nr:response regulator [Desulfacinum hydrothermale]SMC19442.1 two-component system, chemotaxis family, response regulator CheY [Desulfacinum hydrothermale DSM 13146]
MAYKDMKVLVVDDFATMRRIVKNILRELDFKEIYEAENGAAAVKVLESQDVDLIVSDWNMPKMTGLELLKWVRANDKTKDLPFLMVTAEAQKENVVEAVKAKVSNYIVKPFTAAVLAEKLEKILPQN